MCVWAGGGGRVLMGMWGKGREGTLWGHLLEHGARGEAFNKENKPALVFRQWGCVFQTHVKVNVGHVPLVVGTGCQQPVIQDV
jgi:hypothetical protein